MMSCKWWNFGKVMEIFTKVKYDKLKHQMKQMKINSNRVLSRYFMIPVPSAHIDGQRAEAEFCI